MFWPSPEESCNGCSVKQNARNIFQSFNDRKFVCYMEEPTREPEITKQLFVESCIKGVSVLNANKEFDSQYEELVNELFRARNIDNSFTYSLG